MIPKKATKAFFTVTLGKGEGQAQFRKEVRGLVLNQLPQEQGVVLKIDSATQLQLELWGKDMIGNPVTNLRSV